MEPALAGDGRSRSKDFLPGFHQMGQAIARYRAAVDMKNELDADFVIMAQCYARDAANGGLADCLQRLQAYKEVAGMDWV